MNLEPAITWEYSNPTKSMFGGAYIATHNKATLKVVPHNRSAWAWFVTGSHRPPAAGRKDTVEAAKLAAETYELRGITH